MCGITGFFRFASELGDFVHLKAMTDALAHRGPDGEGFFEHPSVPLFLGHRRLSIVDLADGAQPMHSHDGRFVIVFNGEIYNHAVLRRELETLGAKFKTDHSDTEVIIEGFRVWGKDVFQRMNGMWALALWDNAQQRLLLVRDRMGQKPLFWGLRKGVFAFASECHALRMHPAFKDVSVDPLALAKYFGYGFIPAPASLFQSIYKLLPGELLEVDGQGRVARSRYWELPLEVDETISFQDAQTELRHLLSQAVQRRLMADVPVGLFLSGGIDSSTVGYFAQQHGLNRAFYVGFDEPSFDETGYIKTAAQALGLKAEGQTLLMALVPKEAARTLAKLDEPMADPSLIPTSMLCQHAASQVKVAIGGDGADELLAGYDPFLALRMATIYQKLMPRWGHPYLTKAVDYLPVSHKNMSFEFKLKRTLMGLGYPSREWAVRWMAPSDVPEINALLGTSFVDADIYSEMVDLADAHPDPSPFNHLTQYFVHLYLGDNILTKIDRAGMQHGLEVRAPFLDVDLVQFLARLPAHFKLSGRVTKRLLKEAMASHLPKSILQRKKKGFGMPVGLYFQQQGQLAELQALKGLNFELLKKRQAEHREGKANHRMLLWNWLVLQSVLNHYK